LRRIYFVRVLAVVRVGAAKLPVISYMGFSGALTVAFTWLSSRVISVISCVILPLLCVNQRRFRVTFHTCIPTR
jgi:hypothetical protein